MATNIKVLNTTQPVSFGITTTTLYAPASTKSALVTNITFHNPNGVSLDVLVSAGSSGAAVNCQRITVPANGSAQIADVFTLSGTNSDLIRAVTLTTPTSNLSATVFGIERD